MLSSHRSALQYGRSLLPRSARVTHRPRLELLEERVQPGETLFLGFTTLALFGGLPGVEAPVWMDGVPASLDPRSGHGTAFLGADDSMPAEWFSAASLALDTPTAAVREEREDATWSLQLNGPLARSVAARLPLWPVEESAAVASAFRWADAGRSPGLGGVFSNVAGSPQTTDHLLLTLAGLASTSAPFFFDSATGVLTLRGDAGDNTLRQTVTATGFLELTLDGRDYSSDPTAATYSPALAGATATTLRGLRFDGAGGSDTLTLGSQTLAHGLLVAARDAEVIAKDVTTAGSLQIGASRLTAHGTLRAETIALAATGLLNIEKTATLQTAPGGRIEAAADVFVNVGQLRADGPSGGAVLVQARNVLNAGQVTTDGASGPGGTVQVAFTGAYIETTAGGLSARGTTGSGGHILVTGGTSGRLYTSGTQQATGAVGGAVDLLGREVLLVGGTVDASGTTAGGSVRVGGDFQGRNLAVVNAQSVTVTSSATIRANAQESGAGGRVIVWADGETAFAGSVSARGGELGGDGGFIEVSGKGNLEYSGSGDAGAMRGKAGRLLLDPKNIVIAQAPTGVFPQYNLLDPNPNQGGRFGETITDLSSGNVVVTDTWDNFGGSDAGAVYLFNGLTGGLLSSLVGNLANDRVGLVVTPLSNGNYVVGSPNWNGYRGAATWGNGISGVSGSVTAGNSLVGTTPGACVSPGPPFRGDCVGSTIVALRNGHYVVPIPLWNSSQGAVTWGSGTAGVIGPVSAGNSLVGANLDDSVGSNGVAALNNGNYVVASSSWNGGRGAVTWGSGIGGLTGPVSAVNSLVGAAPNDRVGFYAVTALANGNYVAANPRWNSNRGAVTWGNGATGISGLVSIGNSLVGSDPGDQIGFSEIPSIPSISVLTNGSYVLRSHLWNGRRGAVTWGSGMTGVTGAVSADNSLVGANPNDHVGLGGITALSNGNYVVGSQAWDNNRGAATWGSGTAGITGPVSASNSLVGGNAGDSVGFRVTALTKGSYVVRSVVWNGSRGAATWGSGIAGVTGVVSASNSLVGVNPYDQVAWDVTALSNGNYVVMSPGWNDGRGAATWGSGSAGVTGAVSASNSLVGTNRGDAVGGAGATALSNGNYTVVSPSWNGTRGAVTWGNGTEGVSGPVSAANSLVGSSLGDRVGGRGFSYINYVTGLSNGNYVVLSALWNNQRGAVTWGSGTSGVSGPVSAGNSLIGSYPGDAVGIDITPLGSDHYVIASPLWNDRRGATTWMDGFSGRTLDGASTVDPQNSLVGLAADAGLGTLRYNAGSGVFVAPFLTEGGGRVRAGVVDPNVLSFERAQAQTLIIIPNFITQTLNTGTAVTLQASNDITVNAPITVEAGGKGGSLTLQAGRSILLNASITTDNGPLTLIANDTVDSGVVDGQRDPSPAVITMATDTVLDTGTAPLTIELRDGNGLTNPDSGSITLQSVVAGSVSVGNGGPSPDSNLILGTVFTSGPQSYATPNGASIVTGTLTAPNDLVTFADSVEVGDGVQIDVGDGILAFIGPGGVLPNLTLTVTGNVLFDSATAFAPVLYGTEPGTYSRLDATGIVDLGKSTLALVLGFEPPKGAEFELLTGSISGIFQGLDEGATFEQDGFLFQITYQGGPSGSSVVVTRIG